MKAAMKKLLVAGALVSGGVFTGAAVAQPVAPASAAVPAVAQSCEALAADISAKIRANGVRDFELEIVPAKLAEGERVVGSCDRASRKIIYVRTGPVRKAVPAASRP